MKMIVILGLVIIASLQYCSGEEFVCKPGVPYKENDCNGCFCSNNQLACTLMACPWVDRAKLGQCEVGSTWQKDCNKCWCRKDLGTVCENNKC